MHRILSDMARPSPSDQPICPLPSIEQLIGFFGGGLNRPGTKAQLVSRVTDAFAKAKLEIEGTLEELLERVQKYHDTMDKGEAKEADGMHERMVEQVAEGPAELIDGVEDNEEQTVGVVIVVQLLIV